ncbi:uncharacterized protein LOC108330352 [Vigna angularis]|uniref:uncharacterized protein LOC108330352 n=1 Tax=Phaseolus angularis TaxID=3914 RepID=UPI0022B3AC4B|nr:uncharacterized protein LOC108330352 [Vigna angularis]
MCLEGCKQGFLGSCRPLIGVDGCHLKTTYGGQLLVAVGRDPNDQYFPLAFAVVENECKESWSWFLTLLLDDIGGINCQRWVFISDQQKGLMTVFDEILEGVEHRLCLRHLYNNYKKKFCGGVLIRDLMMGAAKATFKQDWEKKMGELSNVNIDAYNWLLAIPTNHWCKHAFSSYPRCDVLLNNLSESFNSTILLARDKLIITMMEWIRTYIMRRFATLREKTKTYTGAVMPKPRNRLDGEVEKSGNWIPTWAGAAKFEVTHRHAVAAINYKLENLEDYVHPYYKREAYETCYGPEINTRATSTVGGSGSTRATSNAGGSQPELAPSTSQGGATSTRGRTSGSGAGAASSHQGGGTSKRGRRSGSGEGPASSHQGGRRTSLRLAAQHLGSQASTN